MATILIIDDTPDIAALLARTVQSQGFRAVVEHSGWAGLKAARESSPDAVVLDIDLPDMTGMDVLAEWKSDAALRHIPVLIVSSRDEDADVIRALDAGAHDFIFEPFKVALVAARVRSAVRSQESRAELLRAADRLRREIAGQAGAERGPLQAGKTRDLGRSDRGLAQRIDTPLRIARENLQLLRAASQGVDRLLDTVATLLTGAQGGMPPVFAVAKAESAFRMADVDQMRQEIHAAVKRSIDAVDDIAAALEGHT